MISTTQNGLIPRYIRVTFANKELPELTEEDLDFQTVQKIFISVLDLSFLTLYNEREISTCPPFIRFYYDVNISASYQRDELTRRCYYVALGTKYLPEGWAKDRNKQRNSRLTNAGVLGHELGHHVSHFLWKKIKDTTEDPPNSGQGGALMEHFSDLMGIGCRRRLEKTFSPWSILYFEELDSEVQSTIVRTFNERLTRKSQTNNKSYLDPHTMSQWKEIKEEIIRREDDQGGIHIGCCILNKVFYDFFTYLQPDAKNESADRGGAINKEFTKIVHIWTQSIEGYLEHEKEQLSFEKFANHTLSKITEENFGSRHREIHMHLKKCWIDAEVLKPSMFTRFTQSIKWLFSRGYQPLDNPS